MSVILVLKMVPDEQIAALLALPRSERLERYWPEDVVTAEARIDIDVAWQALHVLLTGTLRGGEPPASYLLTGGTVIGPSTLAPRRDVSPSGLGEIDRALTSREVAAFHAHLTAISDAAFRRRVRRLYPRLGEAYSGIWRDDPDGDAAYLLRHFRALKRFVGEARRRGLGLLLHFA
jgi:hypothetical protein